MSALHRAAIAALSLAVAAVSWRWLFEPVSQAMPYLAHYLPGHAWQTHAHIFAGPLALALLPVQMSARLRARAPRLHRRAGYLSFAAIVVAGVASLAMLPGFTGGRLAGLGFALLAVLWIGFSGAGILAARARDFARHRRFMLRAAALTFAAVTLRIEMIPLVAAGWTVVETYSITAWLCWVPNLLVVEWMLARPRMSALAGWSGR